METGNEDLINMRQNAQYMYWITFTDTCGKSKRLSTFPVYIIQCGMETGYETEEPSHVGMPHHLKESV